MWPTGPQDGRFKDCRNCIHKSQLFAHKFPCRGCVKANNGTRNFYETLRKRNLGLHGDGIVVNAGCSDCFYIKGLYCLRFPCSSCSVIQRGTRTFYKNVRAYIRESGAPK